MCWACAVLRKYGNDEAGDENGGEFGGDSGAGDGYVHGSRLITAVMFMGTEMVMVMPRMMVMAMACL